VVEEERRRARRARFDGWVTIAAGEVHRIARGRDLSAQGIGLALGDTHPFTEGMVESEFSLPGFYVPVKLPARVAWVDSRTQGLGLRFVEIEDDLAELLEHYVAGRL
jgi:hypothetical protein